MSEELDDFAKEFRAAAVDKKASDLTSLFLVNGQPDRGRGGQRRSRVKGTRWSLTKSLRDENGQLDRHGVSKFDEFDGFARDSPSENLCVHVRVHIESVL